MSVAGWVEKNVKEYMKDYSLDEIRQFDKLSYDEWFSEYWSNGGQLTFKQYMEQTTELYLKEHL